MHVQAPALENEVASGEECRTVIVCCYAEFQAATVFDGGVAIPYARACNVELRAAGSVGGVTCICHAETVKGEIRLDAGGIGERKDGH